MITRASIDRLWRGIGWIGVAIVTYYSLVPNPPSLDIEQGDKVQHLIAYGSLMLWFAQIRLDRRQRIATAAALAAMGVVIEFLQRWTGWRDFSVFDMMANACGVLVGWLAAPPRLPNFRDLARRLLGVT